MNKAILVGNLTRDPELRNTPSGVPVCTFTLAINRRFTNQQGVREADFIPVVVWRQQAEVCARYLSKGRKCAVVGTIQTRTYDAQDGSKRYVTEVVAEDVEFLGSPGQGGGRSMEDVPPPPEPASFTPKATGFTPEAEDDELPF
ncbi:MAG TPA: single-stranded DNA-binding protein [Candidatus Excrementavichristensenella intestinipullorum]|nr:single-stranded DNA-binding protein [Candidatus Excrementavichristensenella intestinipullorum]